MLNLTKRNIIQSFAHIPQQIPFLDNTLNNIVKMLSTTKILLNIEKLNNKVQFPFYKTTIVAKKKLALKTTLKKDLAKYKGVGSGTTTWFTQVSGCLQNTLSSNVIRRGIIDVNRYISVDTVFKTEKKLYFIKKEQKKKWWSVFSYKNTRRKQGLPIRGQRTKTNASTAKKLRIKN